VTLTNIDRYFSKKFGRELPVKRLVEVYLLIGDLSVLKFRGAVDSWTYSNRETITLNLSASLLESIRLRSSSVYPRPEGDSPPADRLRDLSNSKYPARLWTRTALCIMSLPPHAEHLEGVSRWRAEDIRFQDHACMAG